MSDSRLRELERKWRETGASDDEAAYLRERIRIGDLKTDRVFTCVLLGYEPAMQARPEEVPEGPCRLSLMLVGQNPELVIRVFVAMMKMMVRRMIVSPGMRTEVDRVMTCIRQFQARVFRTPMSDPQRQFAREQIRQLMALSYTADTLYECALARLIVEIYTVIRAQDSNGDIQFSGWVGTWRPQVSWLVEESLRACIRDELVPWLLGYGDPLLDPVFADG